MSERFRDRRVLVTGAGSGIGAATARLFLDEGAFVVGADVDEEALARQGFDPSRFISSAGDVTDAEYRAHAVELAAPEGVLHVLVNNAAVFLMAGADATDEQWQRTLDVNLLAPAKLTAAAVEPLARSGRGAVVNVASISAHIAQAQRWTYNSVKGAILHLTRCQALDLAKRGIRVNSVSPGWIWTETVDRAARGDRARWEPVWGAFHALGRCGEPEEVARAILFLGSDDASFVTGADLPVDGGYLAAGPEGDYVLDLPDE